MKEIIDIVAAFDDAVKQGKRTALATVVLVEGSAYRKAGARMLITEDGRLTGAISGGCLEGDALRKARMVILQQEALLVTYDTMDDDDARLGVGLGCNGIIHILIEPILDTAENPIKFLKQIIANRGDAVLVTVFSTENKKSPQPGTCISWIQNEAVTNPTAGISFLDDLIDEAKVVLENRQSQNKLYDGYPGYTAFIEYVRPLISIVIIGAGNDAIPLTRLAAVLGWDITVIDGRNNYALPERFPLANRVIVSKPENVLSHLDLNEQTAVVLMTHNYNYEIALLKQLLPLQLPYLGVLGPRKKLDRMLSELEDEGIMLSDPELRSVYGPVGLDIGSESPEEIGLSIVAEIKAVLSSHKGGSLKYKPVPIHDEPLKVAAAK